MRGLEFFLLFKLRTYERTHGHCDLQTNLAQRGRFGEKHLDSCASFTWVVNTPNPDKQNPQSYSIPLILKQPEAQVKTHQFSD